MPPDLCLFVWSLDGLHGYASSPIASTLSPEVVQSIIADSGEKKHIMVSQGPSSVELASYSNAEASLLTYLATSISSLRKQADSLFNRYKAAGIKYHAMPMVVRDSKNFRGGIIDMLEEACSLADNDRLAGMVVETFGNLIYCIVEAKKALRGTNQVMEAADNFVFDAFILTEKLTKKLNAIESAVADVVAWKNSMQRQGRLLVPDPQLDVQVASFEDWAEAVGDWCSEVHMMTH